MPFLLSFAIFVVVVFLLVLFVNANFGIIHEFHIRCFHYRCTLKPYKYSLEYCALQIIYPLSLLYAVHSPFLRSAAFMRSNLYDVYIR